MSEVHANVARVASAAAEFGLAIEPRRFPEGTKTAVDAAAAIGVRVGQIVKSLIFAVDGEVVLAYVSGANQLDEKKLAQAAGGAKCARVDADTVYENQQYRHNEGAREQGSRGAGEQAPFFANRALLRRFQLPNPVAPHLRLLFLGDSNASFLDRRLNNLLRDQSGNLGVVIELHRVGPAGAGDRVERPARGRAAN